MIMQTLFDYTLTSMSILHHTVHHKEPVGKISGAGAARTSGKYPAAQILIFLPE